MLACILVSGRVSVLSLDREHEHCNIGKHWKGSRGGSVLFFVLCAAAVCARLAVSKFKISGYSR